MNVRVVLVEPEGAINVGFVARTCLNFGVRELYLVNPKANLREALQYAAKAREYLERATIVKTIDEAVRGADMIVATSAKGYSPKDHVRQAVPLRDFAEKMITGREFVVILFGRESTGLTREEIMRADVLVTIPANPEYPVLNLSHSVAVTLYELWIKSHTNESTNIPPPASRDYLERILKLFDEIMGLAQIHETKAERISRILRSIIYRSRLSVDEARLLEYMLYKVVRRLGGAGVHSQSGD